MYYFQHHIGDFRAGCFNMTRLERALYREMLDIYYDTETPLPDGIDAICKLLGVRDAEEKSLVGEILVLKFQQVEGRGWVHERCDREIAHYHAAVAIASKAGKASAAARANKKPTSEQPPANAGSTTVERPLNDRATTVQPTNNQQPITNNQEPKKKTKAAASSDATLFPGVDAQVVADFKQLRKAKRAPITATVMQTVQREAEKAGLSLDGALRICCARGWQGFNADWMQPSGAPGRPSASTAMQVNHLSHASTSAAMAASMERHGIAIPDMDDPVNF